MLPGEAPPGRGPPPGRGGIPPGPGRGPPGPAGAPGLCGRGIGRSTGCTDEKGLLPTRGGRGAPGLGAPGPGRGPGAGRGAAGASAAAAGTAGAGGAGGAAGAGGAGGAAGRGGAGLTTGGAGGAAATPPAAAAAGAETGTAAGGAGVAGAAGLEPPNASRSRRATGASTVDDADLTNSPCSLRRARTSLLVTPSSFANSCTRALPVATTSPSLEAAAVGRPRLGFSYDAWSSGLHGVLMFFATCSFSRMLEPFEMLDHRGGVRCTGDAQRSAECSPSNRRRKAPIVGMQPGTPARMGTCGDRDGRLAVLRRHRHHPEQFDSQLSLPATNAHPIRSGACLSGRTVALYHGSVYRHRGVRITSPNNPAPVRSTGMCRAPAGRRCPSCRGWPPG